MITYCIFFVHFRHLFVLSQQGRSVNAFDLQGKNYPLVFALRQVKGNNIFVSRYSFGSDVAVATIINDRTNFATISPHPLSALSPDDFDFLVSYVNSTK